MGANGWKAYGLVLIIVLASGLVEERLLKTIWGPKGRRFRQAWLLAALSNLSTAAYALTQAYRSPKPAHSPTTRPPPRAWHYLGVGLCVALGDVAYFRSVMHVSFTTANLLPFAELFATTLALNVVVDRPWSTRRWTSAWVVLVATAVYFFSLEVPGQAGQIEVGEFGVAWAVVGRVFVGSGRWLEGRWLEGGGGGGGGGEGDQQEEDVSQLGRVRSVAGLVALVVVTYQHSGQPKVDLVTTPHFAPEWPRNELIFFGLISGLAPALYASASSSAPAATHGPPRSALDELPLPRALLRPSMRLASVVVNAVAFRRVGRVAAKSWTAVLWVAAAHWLKEDPRFDDADASAPKGSTLGTFDKQGNYTRVHSSMVSKVANAADQADPEAGQRAGGGLGGPGGSDLWRQYGPALLLPPVLIIFIRGMFQPATAVAVVPSAGTYVNASTGLVLLEGGSWEKEFHHAVAPVCLDANATRKYTGPLRTALASHERSGNTWTRELVERTTGFQTSTIGYCDKALLKTFKAECDHLATFLVKTHFPRVPADDATSPSTYTKAHSFDQAVHLLRNPIDSIYSEWQLAHSLQNGQLDHAARLEIGLLGAAGPQGVRQKLEALRYARNWARHEAFWRAAPVPVHRVRYEDLMQYKLPTLMGVLAFLLPPEQLPSLSNVACITEQDAAREAYKSRKSPAFAAWDKWDPSLRVEVVRIVKAGWCRNGYDKLLEASLGRARATGVEDVCD